MVQLMFWTIAAYLVGALPTAYIIAKWVKGVDIRRVGSGNPGATNVFRSIGKGPGLLTLFIDMLKGWLPVWLCMQYTAGSVAPLVVGLAAVAGHTWSPFLRFKGGKGVATSGGVFLALLPLATLISLGAFAAAFAVSKHVSVGSLAGAVTLPIAAFVSDGLSLHVALAVVLGLLILVRHIPNIRRLFKGQELSAAADSAKEEL
ncbi:MAG: glycerol-3-phosphate 1-O-acyltransferase PlsY [Elusimicrobia bacterium]|nr:glycerol-3-phosphate 1-O-acyltransferase PlsY [Elusimicrobiota bacterium]